MAEEPIIGEDSPRKPPRPKGYAPLPQQPEVVLSAPQVDEVDNSRARAAKRAAELREAGLTFEEGEDKFWIDPEIIPEGWCYEWKRHTLYNKEDPSYQVSLRRTGWDAVPVYRHPEMMPTGWNESDAITRDGMILMERPMEITIEARENERRIARERVQTRETKNRGLPAGDENSAFDPNQKAYKSVKSYEPLVPRAD